MVRIRLRRMGGKKQPTYRIIVADSRAPNDGAFLEILGHYNPRTNPETVVINQERAQHWLKQGAQPSDTTTRLFVKAGIIAKSNTNKEKT